VGIQRVLIGYAQSWALFRMLMEEQPRAMRQYFELIHPRRTPDHRLADFVEVFGTDLESWSAATAPTSSESRRASAELTFPGL